MAISNYNFSHLPAIIFLF